ncbi:hypothetical protein ACSMXM_05010 [Pacificimonas sp. ICDLI1SI03]
MRTAPDLGQVRIEFRYNKVYSTTADYSDKARRQQFHEGPHEANYHYWLSVNPHCSDFQFQPLEFTFTGEAGSVRYTPDLAIELVTGEIVLAEIKASQAFFDQPEVRRLACEAETHLAQHGVLFARLKGDDFDRITLQTIMEVFVDRRAVYSEHELTQVIEAIRRGGGDIKLDKAIHILGGPEREARAKLNSMMADRMLDVDVSLPFTHLTPVREALPPNCPGALRAFLAGFVVEKA